MPTPHPQSLEEYPRNHRIQEMASGSNTSPTFPSATQGQDSARSLGEKSSSLHPSPLPHIHPQACGWGAGSVPLCVPGSVGMGTWSRRRADH